MMARATTAAWQGQLLRKGYPESLPVALVSRGASADERVLVTSVGRAAADLETSGLKTPVLAVIGRVVTLRARLEPTRSDRVEPRIDS